MTTQSGSKRQDESVGHLPPELVNLPTIKAEPWCQIDPSPGVFLEGPAFDREGNLFITAPTFGIVFKVAPSKQISTIFNDSSVRVCGSAFHKDSRLFVVCLSGELLVISSEGDNVTRLYPEYEGESLVMNDLVFDSRGNIYVTNFTGTFASPTGGVFRLSPDATTVQLIVQGLVLPNGISLSPEGNVLWVGETTRNTIIRIALLDDGITTNPIHGVSYAYYSTGSPGGPDSNRVDAEGNLYQCITAQGRIVILNRCGIPIANVVVPEREEGKHLGTANMAFKPGTREGYMTASGEGGAWIFKFEGLAEGLKLYSHQ